jgi:hypothetical protein
MTELEHIPVGPRLIDGAIINELIDQVRNAGIGIFNVVSYGAKGDGVTDDTDAVNAAVAAAVAAGGGFVYFPYTADSYNFTFSLPPAGVNFAFEGWLTDRSDLGGSAGMKAAQALLVHFPGPHTTSSYTANHIRVIADGSTKNGPSSADLGQTIHVQKNNYLTSQIAGEIDGQYIFIRQGGPNTGEKSAAAACVWDVTGVDGCGFIALYEGIVTLVNSSGVTQKSINVQHGVLNGRDGDYYGTIYTALTGTQDACLYVRDSGSATWNDALRVQDAGNIVNYKIGMDGKTTTKIDNSGTTDITWQNEAGDLVFRNADGDFLVSMQQGGAEFAVGDAALGSAVNIDSSAVTFYNDSGSSGLQFQGPPFTGTGTLYYDATSGSFTLTTDVANITALRGGDVGIGGSPSYRLHATETSAGAVADTLALTNASTSTNTGVRLIFNLSTNVASQSAYIAAIRSNSPANAAAYLAFVINDGTSAIEALRLTERGGLTVQKTITAPATTGNQTIDKTSGRVNIAAAGTTITVTNALVTANSIIMASVASNDTTAQIKNIVPTAGSFTINMVAAVTAETPISFFLVN